MVFNIFRRRDKEQPAPAAPAPAPADDAPPPDGAAPAPPPPAETVGASVPQSLEKARGGFFGAVRNLFQARRELDESFWDELEERLLQADVGAHTTADLVDLLREQHARRGFESPEQAERALQTELVKLLGTENSALNLPAPLAVVLVVGVNGVGKTTSIAKLAHYLTQAGRKPLLVAGDTFRAAAIDQLKVWGERVRVPVIAQAPGSDPSAVVFDGIQAAQGRGADVLVIDTAGRLHTKVNLMEELKKVHRVIQRQIPDAPHETLLVLDAVTGQNALIQATTFAQAVGVTGLVLAKLDSSAKGGVVFSIAQELGTPIKLVGTGEKVGDLAPFDPQQFVAALFA
jgi:fused signal recognition particle receptor